MTLPSDSSKDHYPDNHINHFTTMLNKPIALAGEWEVGLAEISYPQSWYNVQSEELKWSIFKDLSLKGSGYHIPPGIYRSHKPLFRYMKRVMEDSEGYGGSVDLELDKATQKVKLTVGPRYKVWFSPALHGLLGLGEVGGEMLIPAGIYYGTTSIDLSQDLHSMHVYCDLIKPQIFGDVDAPLLRIVPLQRQSDTPEAMNQVFNHIYFKPVMGDSIRTISIDIKDDIGRPVPFMRGRLVVTLVFKKKRSVAFQW